jgi:sensor c-di-GMP phosphodiesterase-like protein
MRRKLNILLATLVAFIAGLAPVSYAIYLAYNTTVKNAEESLRAIAQGIAADTSDLLTDIDQGLIALSGLGYRCSPEDVTAMNIMAYDIPGISDIGIMRPDRKLVCTSWGRIDPPIVPQLPPPAAGFRLLGPLEIRLMERYGLIAIRQREDGSEIGA